MGLSEVVSESGRICQRAGGRRSRSYARPFARRPWCGQWRPAGAGANVAARFQWRARSAQCGCGRSRPCSGGPALRRIPARSSWGRRETRGATGPAMTAIRVQINGAPVADDVPPRLSLADFLRDRRNLTGTHLGCEHGVCGACTVLVDGEPARSCLMLAVACDEREITTIEGFSGDRVIDALRRNFHQHHALQCGYCTPAMLIATRDLILRRRAGSERE